MKEYKNITGVFLGICCLLCFAACQEDTPSGNADISVDDEQIIQATFHGNINLNNPDNYANQNIPNYIDDDNTEGNPITNEGATLGRVLFYDTKLSVTNTVSCASCHQQEHGFSDLNQLSEGVNGLTPPLYAPHQCAIWQ